MNNESVALMQQLLANGSIAPAQYVAWIQSFNIGNHPNTSAVPNTTGTPEIRRFLAARSGESSTGHANGRPLGAPADSRPMPPPTPNPTPVNPMVQNVLSHQEMIGRALYRSQDPQMNGRNQLGQSPLAANGSIQHPIPIPRTLPAPTVASGAPIPNNNLFLTTQSNGAFQLVHGRTHTSPAPQNGGNHLGQPTVAPQPVVSNGGDGAPPPPQNSPASQSGAPSTPAPPRQPRFLVPSAAGVSAYEAWRQSGRLSYINDDGTLHFKVAGEGEDEEVRMSRNHFLVVLEQCIPSNPTIILQFVGEAMENATKNHSWDPNFLEGQMAQLNKYRELLTNLPLGRFQVPALMMEPPPTLQDERSGTAQRNGSADSGEAPVLDANAIHPAMQGGASSSLQAVINGDGPSCSYLPQQHPSMVKDNAQAEKPKKGGDDDEDSGIPPLKKIKNHIAH